MSVYLFSLFTPTRAGNITQHKAGIRGDRLGN